MSDDEAFRAAIHRNGAMIEYLYGRDREKLRARAVKKLNTVAWSTTPHKVVVARRAVVMSKNWNQWEELETVLPEKT